MTPAQEHEEHVARVLGLGFQETAQAAGEPLVTVMATAKMVEPRQHHSEAADVLVVEALQEAQVRIYCQRVDGCPQDGYTCPNCRAINKIDAALKALGK